MPLPLPNYLTNHTTNIFLGLGREAWSTYSLIHTAFPNSECVLVDDTPLAQLDPHWLEAIRQSAGKVRYLSSAEFVHTHVFATTPTKTVVYKSPGIPLHHHALATCTQAGVVMSSNTQLFFDILKDIPENHDLITIGVTGTKGKSTTTAFIHQLLTTAGKTAYLGGNIGVPPLDTLIKWQLTTPKNAYFCLELSSHQLLDVHASPHIAVIQDITPEHLDYYPDAETYYQAKSAITTYQTSHDIVIYCPQDPVPAQIVAHSLAQPLDFGITNPPLTEVHPLAHTIPSQQQVEKDIPQQFLAYVDGNTIYYNNQPVMHTNQVALPGRHNLRNILPGIIIAGLADVSMEVCVKTAQEFVGLPHRLQLIAQKNDVAYVNDSLSTTPVASIVALQAVAPAPTVLIAGGYDRKLDYSHLAQEILTQQVVAVVLFTPSGSRIAHAIRHQAAQNNLPTPPIITVADMQEAVQVARQHSPPGGVVLLSPASPSFGLFKDYAHRGQAFEKVVQSI